MKATAFEILLEPNDPFQKRKLMTRRLHQLTDTPGVRQRSVRIGTDRQTGRGKYESMNAVAAWLNQFYHKRNRIVHGDKIGNEAFIHRSRGSNFAELDIADIVLWEAISWELASRKLIAAGARAYARRVARAIGERADDGFIKQATRGELGISEYHEALGWCKT